MSLKKPSNNMIIWMVIVSAVVALGVAYLALNNKLQFLGMEDNT